MLKRNYIVLSLMFIAGTVSGASTEEDPQATNALAVGGDLAVWTEDPQVVATYTAPEVIEKMTIVRNLIKDGVGDSNIGKVLEAQKLVASLPKELQAGFEAYVAFVRKSAVRYMPADATPEQRAAADLSRGIAARLFYED